MSTKTTIKRISLVAVAALGFGVLSVVPSQAADPNPDFAFTAVPTAATPVRGSAVSIPIKAALTADGSVTAAITGTLTATITTKPANSLVVNDSITASLALATLDTSTTGVTLETTTVNAVRLTSKTGTTGAAAETATVFSFTPDVAGYYVITFTPSGSGAGDETMDGGATGAAATYGITVSGSSAVQAASGLGTSAANQILGRQSAVAFYLPFGTTTASRYEISATGVGIVGIFEMTADLVNVAAATDATGVTRITKKNGTDYTAGATYAGRATVTRTVAAGSAVRDGIVVTVNSAVAATGTITVQSVNGTTGELTTVSSATVTYAAAAAAASTLADATSTSIIAKGALANSAQTVDSATVTASMVVGTQAATIYVTQKSAITTAVPNESMTVTISGPGLLGTGAGHTASATGRSLLVKNTDYITVWPDGSAGVATITIVGTTSGVTLGVEKVTFHGAATKLVAALTTDAATSAGVGSTKTTSLTITAKDAADVLATNPSGLTVKSSDTAVATVAISGNNTVTITGVKAGTAVITVTDPATTTPATAATYTITVKANKSLTAPTITFDKTSYAVGELVTMTVGADMADSATAQLFTSTGLVLSAAVVASGTAIPTNGQHAIVSGVATYKFYAPAVSGTLTVTGTAGSDIDLTTLVTAPVVTKTVDITNPSADAATAAAELAEAAAQDATDAALDATEAATLAGALAQEAVDAVADLSTQVATLISALKKQITTLTNLVIKIQKKVRA